ncbi:MAG: flippase-like domain-containing protein, partial [Leptospiraceae bacterium]|nr:flippase-like domain-containing protein [Leptospiraceae bacterium]
FLNTGRGDAGSFAIFSFSGMVVVGVFIVLFLLRFQNEWIDKTLLKLFHLIKKEEVYKSHMQVHIFELKKFLSFKMLLNPLLVTIVMWACYSLTYYYTGLALAVPMNAAEITFVIFFGAISLAVPSAPSGVGVFHASVISAFIVLKKTSSLGLFFATGIHLLGFVVFTVVGFLFYFYWIYKRRNGKPVNFKEFEDTEKIGN